MKINEKNLAVFATSGTQVDKEGYLNKRGEGHKSFNKKWFILKGNLLFYFEKKNDREPLGVLILEGSRIELGETEVDEHFCFKIVFPSRSYVLSAESHEVMESWMKALACASYDYVKLMAAELQRQLDELSKETHNSNDGREASGSQLAVQEWNVIRNKDEIPTPPPRQKHIKGRNKRTFPTLHEEFGRKILEDQTIRWGSKSNQL